MKNKYPHMFSPITIGNVTFKNRVWTAPAKPHLLGSQEPWPNDHEIQYYSDKAKGGAAVITISAQMMHQNAPGGMLDDITVSEGHRMWVRLTDAIHFWGAKASLEMGSFMFFGYDENGKLVHYTVNGGEVEPDGSVCVALNEFAMKEIANRFADAAESALKCGFDMILIHGGHGLPMFQFLSPVYNRRTDEYGGSLENRAKFPMMVIDAVRERVGRKLLIEYRISGDEFEGEKGFGIEDCIDFLELIQDKIDIAHVSAGGFINNTEHITHPSSFLPTGTNTYLAEAVKKSGRVHIPVLTLGGYQRPEDIERCLAEGRADIVSMARGAIADAELVNKARTDREDEIIPCIRCLHCLDYERADKFCCSVNPTVGRELRLKWNVTPATEKKKVVIIGGGPAGMEAAITARQRGHDVTIIEKSDRLGGALRFSDLVWFKKPLNDFMNYLIHMTEKCGLKVMLGTEATPEMVKAMEPDVVIAGVGAEPAMPPVKVSDNSKVMFATDIYGAVEQGKEIPKKVIILGGGDIGCETAEFLHEKFGTEIVIVEMTDKLRANTFHIASQHLRERLESHAEIHYNTVCTEINNKGMLIKDKDGEHQLNGDLVCVSTGMKPKRDIAERFRDCAEEFIIVGDCYKPSSVRLAVQTGYDAGIQI